MLLPQIPVGGRLKHFIQEWESITDDQWVLKTLQEGLKLEFQETPHLTGIKHTSVNARNLPIILAEVEDLIEKNAIEIVPQAEIHQGFYSTLFLVPKKTGDLRPVINLKPLNQYLRKQHFKMDTLTKVLNLVKPQDWALSLDLKDAYLHIPVHKTHRKFLRFCIQGKCYQFVALCFGPSQAPRVFTKIVTVVAAHLRIQNIRLATYLDDWLLVNAQEKMLISDREKTLNLLIKLGFIVNLQKSSLIPSQEITYIGALFNFKKEIVSPTMERILKLEMLVISIMKGHNTARDYLMLLGLIASCIELIPNARLYMRPIQLHLLHFWKPSTRDLTYQIPFTQHLKDHLNWWLDRANTTKGKSLHQWSATLTITTDASKTGFGGHMNNQIFQGFWSVQEQKQHINLLELEAVIRTVQHFLPQLQNQNVLLKCDNTTVVQYVNKQGGTKSIHLCYKTWCLMRMAIQNNLTFRAAHIAGKLNVLADHLSRNKIQPTEWTLNNQIVQSVFAMWGEPTIDLFASVHNHKRPVFCAWIPHPSALAVDALSISWEKMWAYAFPPICLIPKVLKHMSQFNCRLILIAPMWPRRHWYTELLQKSVASPIKLPIRQNLLYQPKTNIYHPNPEVFTLTAWLLSTKISEIRDFQEKLESFSEHHGDLAHSKTMLVNSKDFIVGVVNGKKIPMQLL